MPVDLDRELVEQDKLLNITPKRFEQLRTNNESEPLKYSNKKSVIQRTATVVDWIALETKTKLGF
jgi:hypothetical protein